MLWSYLRVCQLTRRVATTCLAATQSAAPTYGTFLIDVDRLRFY